MNDPVAIPVQPTPNVSSSEPVKSAVDDGQILDEGLDISSYRGTHGNPFVADYFGIGDYYKTNSEVAQQVDQVTQHIIDKSQGQSLVYVAKQILDQYSEEMNLEPNDTGLYRIKKILGMISARQRVDELEKLKQLAIQDIESMV